MNNYRLTIMLLIIFAVLLGCYLYLNNAKPYEATKEVFGFKKGSIQEIAVSATNVYMKFLKQDNHWTMVEPSLYKTDQEKLFSLEELLNHLTIVRIIIKEMDDLSRYGLEKPTFSITVKLNNGEISTLSVGAETASKTEYYAMESHQRVIYTINKNDLNRFTGVPSDFRDRSLLTIDPAFITTLSMVTNSGLEFKLVKGSNGKWRFSLPVQANVKGNVLKETFGMIVGLKIQDFITDQTTQLEKYGLDKPSYILAIGDKNGKVQTIYFGKEDQSKRSIYIKNSGSNEIYTVSSDGFRPDNVNMGRLFDVAPLSIGIGDVNKIVIVDQSHSMEFCRDASKQDDIFTLSGKSINKADFTTMYVNIMSLTSEGYDPGNKVVSPGLSVLYELKGNKKIKAEFSQRNDNSYFITVDGKPLPFYIQARKVELVRKWLQRVYKSQL